jgi:hypothetical protein
VPANRREKSRRLEVRDVWTVDEPAMVAYLNPDGAWPKLRSVAMVVAERHIGEESSRETRYYLSSLPSDAAIVGRAVRSHWGIENRLHWVLDIAFREDEKGGCMLRCSRTTTADRMHRRHRLRGDLP